VIRVSNTTAFASRKFRKLVITIDAKFAASNGNPACCVNAQVSIVFDAIDTIPLVR